MLPHPQPVVISFSGIDGAGKSTQIERLCTRLREHGIAFTRFALWDDVVPLARARSRFSHRVLHCEGGVGTPERPVKRSDKNVRRWYLTGIRAVLYTFDAICLRRAIDKAGGQNLRLIIFDRYIFDQLANIPDNWLGRFYTRTILRVVPAVGIAFLLDADPQAALLRKPEYPLGFLKEYRQSYFSLQRMVPELVVVPGGDVDTVEHQIWNEIKTHSFDDSLFDGNHSSPRERQLNRPTAIHSLRSSRR